MSGSYYLVTSLFSGTNLNDAINIRTNVRDITIDLNGFSIINTNGAGGSAPVGVRISEATNIVIRNGHIVGFDRGIRAEGLFYGVVAENLHVNKCRRAGIEGNGVVGDMKQTITIRNCVLEDMDSTGEATNISEDGVTLLNCSATVQYSVIRDIVASGRGISTCIDAQTCTNTFFDNNLLANAGLGIKTTGVGTRYFYRNNLTAGTTNAFGMVVGGVDRGGNF